MVAHRRHICQHSAVLLKAAMAVHCMAVSPNGNTYRRQCNGAVAHVCDSTHTPPCCSVVAIVLAAHDITGGVVCTMLMWHVHGPEVRLTQLYATHVTVYVAKA